MSCLIVCEKPSAARMFAEALGGMNGQACNTDYRICALRGHLLEFKEPHEQVAEHLVEQYRSWKIENLPWDIADIAFKREPMAGTIEVLDALKREIAKLGPDDEIAIATDVDPSGEGELLAWEAIEAAGGKGRCKVTRLYFVDESATSIRKAFETRKAIASMETDGDYVKADTRSRWDYMSMQLTRAASCAARKRGFKGVIRQGRLKSVMVAEVGKQLDAIKNYVEVPFYALRFKDDAGNVFALPKETEDRKASETDIHISGYTDSAVVEHARETKRKAPDRLLDLAGLSAILAKEGYDPGEVLDTYQKLYEAQIVSYPRTEDKIITTEQFKQFLSIAYQVADLIGIDKALLTHTQPRKSHVKDAGAHGANRPGPNVPATLDVLSTYGKSAARIYVLLAKNALAMLAEDYVYEQRSAHLEAYPEYKSAIKIGISDGYKAVFCADEDSSNNEEGKAFGATASPFIHKGKNAKPKPPTIEWLTKRLERFEVGTGATRTSTLDAVISGPDNLLANKKGKLTLTPTGEVSYALLHGCRIASPEVTEQLFLQMEDVGAFKMSARDLLATITPLVQNDIAVMLRNAEHMIMPEGMDGSRAGACPVCGQDVVKRGSIYSCITNKSERREDGSWAEVAGCGFKIFPFCGKTISSKQASSLLEGKRVALKGCKSKQGNTFDCDIKVEDGKVVPLFKKRESPRSKTSSARGRRRR